MKQFFQPLTTGLAPYTGEWTTAEARHLLRRTTFGATYAEVQRVTAQGLAATLSELTELRPLPAPPLATNAVADAPVGETWVNRPFKQEAQYSRRLSLASWIVEAALTDGVNLREKLLLFWHDHFSIRAVNDPRVAYRYLDTVRRHTFGNFREFVYAITIDPAMLRFLNGTQSNARSPNENYARELLELFTIGKGPQIGPGDYSNYTEEDIQELARALTGWRQRGNRGTDGDISSYFTAGRHDRGRKQLSYHFGNAVIENAGEDEYKVVVDTILEQEEVARYIVRKLYRYFLYHEITPEIEAEVIEPLANLFRENDYEVLPVLQNLFASAHFYEITLRGPMIKNPVDFTFGMLRTLEVDISVDNPQTQDFVNFKLLGVCEALGMVHLDPPTVAGWKAYYQEPLYYRQWINSNTLAIRTKLAEDLTTRGLAPGRNIYFQPNLLQLIEQFPNPGNLTEMITGLAALLMPRPLADEQIAFLKDLVIPGLPDTQWAVEYANYLSNPNDEAIAAALETKLRRTVKVMLTMPEYQLS